MSYKKFSKRKNLKKRSSRKNFTKYAKRVNPRNSSGTTIRRGGIRF